MSNRLFCLIWKTINNLEQKSGQLSDSDHRISLEKLTGKSIQIGWVF